MTTPDPAIAPWVVRLERASVRYVLRREVGSSMKGYAIGWIKGQRSEHLWALRDVSLEIRRGETVGVIGDNGSGKSTLLRLIARVLQPTAGRVRVRGRVAPLLELASGFDYELSGRENVFLNGTMLGWRKADLAQRLGRIVEFAELGDFIDVPLRMYSAGMVARLAFAIATDVDPDVLVVDEVLGVGDVGFQRKSAVRLAELRERSDAIIMASHALDYLEHTCQRVAWLERGRLRAMGAARTVIEEYLRTKGDVPPALELAN